MDAFAGKTAIVTGAGSGIGLGLARTFAAAGMNVAVLDVRAETLTAAAAQVEAFGVRALPLAVDVCNRGALAAAADAVERAFGKFHVVCNNAGVLVFGKPIIDSGSPTGIGSSQRTWAGRSTASRSSSRGSSRTASRVTSSTPLRSAAFRCARSCAPARTRP